MRITNRIILVGIMVCIALFIGGILGGVGTAQAQTDYSTAPDCSTVSYNGSGTSSDPFEVSDPYELQCIGNSSDTTFSDDFELIKDINMSETENWNDGGYDSGLKRIGQHDYNNEDYLNGTLYGNGNVVKNIHMNTTQSDAGMFSAIGDTAVIKNMGVTGTIEGSSYTGGIVGRSFGTINKVYFKGTVVSGSGEAGGIAGINFGLINNSYSIGYIESDGGVGGIVGLPTGDMNIKNSYSAVDLNAPDYEGAISGGTDGTVKDSYFDKESYNATKIVSSVIGLNTNEITGSEAESNMSGFDFTSDWSAIKKEDGYTEDGYPILQDINEQEQLSAQSISTVPYYDLTVNVDHNSSNVDTDYEILDDTDSVVASGNTGTDGTVTENLVEGTYDVKLAHADAQYSNITTTVTLDSAKTISESLSKNSYDLTINPTTDGTTVDTDFEIEDSSGTVVSSGDTGSDGTVTKTLNYGTYDIVLAQNDTSYNTTTKTTTVDSDKTVAVSLSDAYYTLSIKAEDSTGGVNTTYAVINTSNQVVVSSTTNNSSYIDISLVTGDYDIEIAYNDSNYTNTTETITLDQNVTKTYTLSDSGGGGLFGDSGSTGILIVGVVISVAGFAIATGSSTSGRKRRNK